VVVEAETVDQRLRLDEAKQPRPRIARLRARRHGAAFDEAEPERRQRIDVRRILVEPGGEADAIGKLEAHHGDRDGGTGGVARPATPKRSAMSRLANVAS
jgi:hypothetical protein